MRAINNTRAIKILRSFTSKRAMYMYMYTCNKGHHNVMMMSHHVTSICHVHVCSTIMCMRMFYICITHCCAVVLANSTQHLVQQSDRVFNLVNKFIIQTYHHRTLPASPPIDHELIIPSFVITLQRDIDMTMAMLQGLTVSIDLLPVHKMAVCACTGHTLATRHTLLTEWPLNLIDCRKCGRWKLYELDTY